MSGKDNLFLLSYCFQKLRFTNPPDFIVSSCSWSFDGTKCLLVFYQVLCLLKPLTIYLTEQKVQMAGCNFCSSFDLDWMALVLVHPDFKIYLLFKTLQIPTWYLQEEGTRQLRLIFVVIVVSGKRRPVVQQLLISFVALTVFMLTFLMFLQIASGQVSILISYKNTALCFCKSVLCHSCSEWLCH